MLPSLPGTPRTNAARIVASRHAVPDALNQFNSNNAAYGVGFATTGGTCVIWLWRPGTMRRSAFLGVSGAVGSDAGINPSAKWLMRYLMLASPHASTTTTSSKYGTQAMKI